MSERQGYNMHMLPYSFKCTRSLDPYSSSPFCGNQQKCSSMSPFWFQISLVLHWIHKTLDFFNIIIVFHHITLRTQASNFSTPLPLQSFFWIFWQTELRHITAAVYNLHNKKLLHFRSSNSFSIRLFNIHYITASSVKLDLIFSNTSLDKPQDSRYFSILPYVESIYSKKSCMVSGLVW